MTLPIDIVETDTGHVNHHNDLHAKTNQVFNVEVYGATGDGVTNDTSAIQSAITAAPAGSIVYFPDGTYLTDRLTTKNNITLRGSHPRSAILLPQGTPTSPALLDINDDDYVYVEGLGFDGNLTTAIVAIDIGAGSTGVRIDNCYFVDWRKDASNAAAIHAFDNDDCVVKNSSFVDCTSGVTFSRPGLDVAATGNWIMTTATDIMARGISVRDSVHTESDARVINNRIEGADLQPNEGAGHGIFVDDVGGVTIMGNTLINSGRGVLVGQGGWGAAIIGNIVDSCNEGIRLDLDIDSTDITIGTDENRGASIIGNIVRNSVTDLGASHGITASYSAGSIIANNIVYEGAGNGIFVDSDKIIIMGNTCYNNFLTEAVNPGNEKAGITIANGVGSIVIGNVCFDNQTAGTQEYGLSIRSQASDTQVGFNNFTDNTIGEIHAPAEIVPRDVIEVATTYTITYDDKIVNVDTSGGGVTLTLPSVADAAGREFLIRRDGASTVTLDRAGSDTFDDGDVQKTLDTDSASIRIFSVGDAEWKIVAVEGTVGGS